MKKLLVILTILGGGAAYASFPEDMTALFGSAMSHQVTQFTFAFSFAAWLHAGRVKKEIKDQLGGISISIDGVTQALRLDLQVQSKRLESVENAMTAVVSRVDKLEKKSSIVIESTINQSKEKKT